MIDSSATICASSGGRMTMRAARQALADIVVGVADQLEGDAARQEGAEALPGRAGQLHLDGVVRQALVADSAWRPRPTAWRRPSGRHCGSSTSIATGCRRFERRLRLLDQLAVEHVVDRMVLALGPVRSPRAGASGL